MFFSGMIAERVSLRYFLSLGMLFSGFFCYAFGYAKTKDIHSMLYFVIVQGLAGIFQTTGWPGVSSRPNGTEVDCTSFLESNILSSHPFPSFD